MQSAMGHEESYCDWILSVMFADQLEAGVWARKEERDSLLWRRLRQSAKWMQRLVEWKKLR